MGILAYDPVDEAPFSYFGFLARDPKVVHGLQTMNMVTTNGDTTPLNLKIIGNHSRWRFCMTLSPEVGIMVGDARNRLKKDVAEGRSRKCAQP